MKLSKLSTSHRAKEHIHLRRRFQKNGFTLLEVILAISIMAMLIGSIFTITNSSVLLSQSIVENQNEYRHKAAFESYLETLLMNLPHEAKFELVEDENSFQSLTIHNPGTYFPSFQNDRYASLFTASITKNRDGLLDLRTTWSSSPNLESEYNNSDPQQSLTLIGRLTTFKWQIYSVKDKVWYPTWNKELNRPSHIRVTYTFSNDREENTRTFWIPPRMQIR